MSRRYALRSGPEAVLHDDRKGDLVQKPLQFFPFIRQDRTRRIEAELSQIASGRQLVFRPAQHVNRRSDDERAGLFVKPVFVRRQRPHLRHVAGHDDVHVFVSAERGDLGQVAGITGGRHDVSRIELIQTCAKVVVVAPDDAQAQTRALQCAPDEVRLIAGATCDENVDSHWINLSPHAHAPNSPRR